MKALANKNSNLVEGKDVLLSEEITIFLFDCSGSMYDRIDDDGSFYVGDPYHLTKFKAMKDAATKFVGQRIDAVRNGASDSVGVITFGDDVRLIHDPSSRNFENLLQRISKMSCTGSTPMAQAVQMAIDTAERFTSGMIRVVICSDGQPDNKHYVLDCVRRGFEEYGIIFDTIGIGRPEGVYGLDEEFLKLVADTGGGEYTRITSYQEFSRKLLSIESERQLLLGSGILMLPSNDTI